jgi:serine/threonine-protein kinase
VGQHDERTHDERIHSEPPASGALGPFYLRSTALGDYRVDRILSTGATGGVVCARHGRHGARVVIKLLHPDLCHQPAAIARLSREAHVLSRVASEHTVRLLDTGWTELAGPYIVLEQLEGMDLAKTLEAKGPLPTALAVNYLLQACAGLRVAHEAGITHRDLKPENLFAVEGTEPTLKLLDFGIAQHGPQSFPYREVAASDPELQLMGTPAYMAPERIRDLPTTDHRSDIWSLGVVLHELLTGHALFGRDDVADTCARVVRHRFELETDRSILPTPLRVIVARCLARAPEHRYQSVQELVAALASVSVLPVSSRGLMTGKFPRQPSVHPEALSPLLPHTPQRLSGRRLVASDRGKRYIFVAIVAAMTVLLFGVCAYLALGIEPLVDAWGWVGALLRAARE